MKRRRKTLAEPVLPELKEWLAFAVVREPRGRSSRRELFEGYEIYAASEGHPAISEILFVRQLERLGLRRRGTTFLGVRVRCQIHALRLLTRLEIYGFRFASAEGELRWKGPAAVSDLEHRVIGRHSGALLAALRQIEHTREMLRGHLRRTPPAPVTRLPRRAA